MVVASFVVSLFRDVDLKSKRAFGVLMIADVVGDRQIVSSKTSCVTHRRPSIIDLQPRGDLGGYRRNAAAFDAINLLLGPGNTTNSTQHTPHRKRQIRT